MNEVRQDIKSTVIEPYIKVHPEIAKSEKLLDSALNFDSIWELKKYSYCFNESLRMEPPVM